jgi:Na+-translocating ferredoxin:NAD+ oxidoreductase RnfD subunit
LLGNVIYFIVLGLVTAGLRYATGMEVVSFAILLMNLFVPMFDKFIIPRPFGFKKVKKEGNK